MGFLDTFPLCAFTASSWSVGLTEAHEYGTLSIFKVWAQRAQQNADEDARSFGGRRVIWGTITLISLVWK